CTVLRGESSRKGADLPDQELGYDFTPMNFSETRFPTVEIILFAYTRHKGIWQESFQPLLL
ncbi:hypothetical protein, partial [Bacteroides sp.]|uniref:hypothetical protein n=1 Tax=Bacteroides sp. TaxID=29523 RepID=UPI00257E252F